MDIKLIACAGCKAMKPPTEYYTLHSRGDRLASMCKDCTKAAAKGSHENRTSDIEADDAVRCLLCHEIKRGVDFHTRKDRRGGRPVCMPCYKAYAAKYGVDLETNKKYRLPDILIIDEHKECSGCHQSLHVSQYAKNLSAPHGLDWKCKECQRIHREAYVGKRHRENPSIYWQSRLKNRNIYGDLSLAFVRNLYESHKYCEYCGVVFNDPREAFFEHRIPRAKGGTTIPENVTFACDQCNRAKNDMPEKDFRAWLSNLVERMSVQPSEIKIIPLHEYAAKHDKQASG